MKSVHTTLVEFLWLIYCLCFPTQLHGLNTKPVIRTHPVDTYSSDGALEFSCQADGSPKPLITWYDAETRLPVVDRVPTSGSTSGIHVNQHYGQLMISNPMRDTIYSFYCNASNAIGWTISQPPVRGGLAYLDSKFQKIPRDISVHETDSVELPCQPPKGFPPPQVMWLRDNKPFASNQKPAVNFHVSSKSVVNVMDGGNLKFVSISPRDSGQYTCVAVNIAGQRRAPVAQVYVKHKIQFLETPKPLRIRQGTDAKFKCRTEGNHLVRWSKQHGIIDPSRAELGEDYLILKQVQLSDSGVYICTAPGSIVATAKLIVDTPPKFSHTPDDLTVQEGSIAVFHCSTSGFPEPSIYWELADSTPLFPSEHDGVSRTKQRFTLYEDGRLEIRNVKMQDAGKYQCTAHSSIDRIHSSAILQVIPRSQTNVGTSDTEVDVRSIIHQLPIAPIIGLPPANQTRIVGEVVTLDCELNLRASNYQAGGSQWTIAWYRSTRMTNGLLHRLDIQGTTSDHRYTILPGGSLQIYDVQLADAGLYLCSAQSLIKIPMMTSNRQIPGDYLLQSNWTAHLQILPSGSSMEKAEGHDNPLSPPRNLRVINQTESTITLVWDPSTWVDPMNPDSPQFPQRFWVEYFRPDHWMEGWKLVERDWRATTVRISGLDANTAYYFLIRPRREFGRVGWASAPIGPIFTLQKSPAVSKVQTLPNRNFVDAVRDLQIHSMSLYVIDPEQLRATWSVHTLPEILSIINGYTIQYQSISLLKCISNYLDISGIDQMKAESMREGYCSLKSGETNPPHLIYARIQQLHRNRAETITANKFNLDIPTTFSAELLNHNDPQMIVYESSGLIKKLKPFSCYRLSVKAFMRDPVLGIVESQESRIQNVLMFESFPTAAPSNISAKWCDNNELLLNWEPPSAEHWNGLLTAYIIYIYNEATKQHHTHNISYAMQTTIIRGLDSPHVYHLQMAALTCKGIGLRSVRLTLKPDLRKPDLGVGWGFDDRTGLPIDQSNTGQLSDKQKPLFVTMFIAFVILFLVSFVFLTWCLCTKRYWPSNYKQQQQQPSVLITNTPLNGDVATLHDSSNNRPLGNGKPKHDRNSVQLEPLLHQRDSGKMETTNIGTPRINSPILNQTSVTYSPSMSDQNTYGLYSLAEDAINGRNIIETGVELNPDRSQCGMDSVGFRYDSAQQPVQKNRMIMPINHQGFNGPVEPAMLNYNPLPYAYQSPNYITYQPIQASPSQHDFSNFSAPTNTSFSNHSSGLPPIAPVAQLNNGTQHDPSLFYEMENAPTSVTPYATASIIQLRPQHQSTQVSTQPQIYPPQPIFQNNWLTSQPHHSSQSSYSSNENGKSGHMRNATYPITDGIPPTFGNLEMNMVLQPSLVNPQSTNLDLSSDATSHRRPLTRDTNSSQSKSDSTASTNTQCSEEKSIKGCSMPIQVRKSTSQQSSNPAEVSRCDSVYSLVSDDPIPPPPASPPPPAPNCHREQVSLSTSARRESPSPMGHKLTNGRINEFGDSSMGTSLNRMANAKSSHVHETNGIIYRPKLNRRKYSEYVSANRDEQQNPTYAQVY